MVMPDALGGKGAGGTSGVGKVGLMDIPDDSVRGKFAEAVERLEVDIALAVPAGELADRLSRLQCELDEGSTEITLRLRMLIARATIEHRQRKVAQALATANEARQIASVDVGVPYRSRISRLIANIHSWGGSGERAMAELLRAVAEAHLAGDEVEIATSIADGGRACKEIKRYDAALLFFASALSSPGLHPLERQRVVALQAEMMNRLERCEECLALVAANASDASLGSQRTRFLLLLEEARALCATGEPQRALAVLESARGLLPPDPGAYEHVEWNEVAGELPGMPSGSAARAARGQTVQQEPSGQEARLRTFVARFQRDALHEKEADARLELAEFLHKSGNAAGALKEAASALALALRRRQPRIEERARSAMLRFGWDDGVVEGRGLLQGRYVVGEPLGSGGYGVVRRAFDLESGAERAVKFITLDGVADANERRRLIADAKAEIDVASRVRAPGLIRLHAAFVDGDTIVVVQDLHRGRTLEDHRGRKLDSETALRFFALVARAVSELHEAGVVHGDLKPDNIMVDDLWRPTLVDFGLARLIGVPQDGASAVRGADDYIAPELVSATERTTPDVRHDIFALGVVLRDFLPPDLHTRRTRLFGFLGGGGQNPLGDLVDAMRAREPHRRPASMREVATVLERRLADGLNRSGRA